MKRKGGQRRKMGKRMAKHPRDRGKMPLTGLLRSFQPGQRVRLLPRPDWHSGLFWMRLHYGKTGTVLRQRGRCYEVEITDGGKKKIIITSPAHLVPE